MSKGVVSKLKSKFGGSHRPAKAPGSGRRVLSVFGVIALGFAGTIVYSLGATNAYTPAGYEGYVYRQPLAIGQREFIRVQSGPTSTGLSWRQFVTNIDMRINTYSEELQIFSSDNLEIAFEAHVRIRLRPGTAREMVERYSGVDWYANNVRRPYTTAVREAIRQRDAFAIKDEAAKVSMVILERLRREYAETPFEFISLTIGNISFPKSVQGRVIENLASEQRRQRMIVEQQIAEARAGIREVKARGEAEAQQIEQLTLTPLYVQHEAAELYRELATEGSEGASKAKVVVVIPTRSDRAGVPHIFQGGAR